MVNFLVIGKVWLLGHSSLALAGIISLLPVSLLPDEVWGEGERGRVLFPSCSRFFGEADPFWEDRYKYKLKSASTAH